MNDSVDLIRLNLAKVIDVTIYGVDCIKIMTMTEEQLLQYVEQTVQGICATVCLTY